MQCSFSFCGKDVTDIGLKYAPDNSNTYIYNSAETNIQEQTFEGHDGGYFYGVTKQPKVFQLRCYYEDESVLNGLMTRISHMFKIGRSGKLVFTVRPWLYYVATVVDVDTSKLINAKNGLVLITMKAYYPFGRTDVKYIDKDDPYSDDMLMNSAMFEEDINPVCSIGTSTSSLSHPLLIYNGGTERAAVKVDIAGDVGSGVTIYNETTGQEMEFMGLHEGSTSEYVECDGLTGNCYWVSNNQAKNGKNAFIYHSQGFIELEPGYPLVRDIDIKTTASSNIIETELNDFTEDMIDHYIYADGEFRRITSISEDGKSINVDSNCTNTAEEQTVVAKMNRIFVTPDTTMNLSYLAFKYAHTFS